MSTTVRKKPLSHIAIMRTEGIITQLVIKEKLKLSGEEYGLIVFDSGVKFLEIIYPDVLQEYRQRFEYSPMFWKWFKNEWVLWEQAFMTFAYNDAVSVKFYKQWMFTASQSANSMSSFSLFLKIITDVKV